MDLIAMRCCGIREITSLGGQKGPTDAMRRFYSLVYRQYRFGFRCSHAIFSQADLAGSKPYGKRFATFITRHKLGTVVASETVINPNSSHPLTVWIWTLDTKALTAWYAVHGTPRRRQRA